MIRLGRSRVVAVVVALLVAAGCSGTSEPQATTSCAAAAQQVVDRFDAFLEPFSETTADEFLASSELAGLEEFQNDVAETIVRVATNPNDNCTEQGLEAEVDLALANYAGQDTLNQYLVELVRQGIQVETRDVAVSPDDDLVAILATLGPGSSVTFSEGTFTLDASILVQGDLILVGAGQDETILESTADTAVLAVLGGGSMIMNDFTIRHVGDVPASVVIAVDASLEMVNMTVSGGVVDEEGGGGSGVVLTETDQSTTDPVVAIDQSTISDNSAAGIAVTGSYTPSIVNSVIESNGQCGICFFDTSGGQTQSTVVRSNGVGIQVSNQATPELALNMFTDNLVAGLLIDDDSAPTILENTFEAVDIVGIDVQDGAAPVLQRNVISGHAVGISLRGTSTASVSETSIGGADVGLLVGGSATPVVFDNLIDQSQIAGILHTEMSVGEFTSNVVMAEAGAGIVAEGSAAPIHVDATIEGGLVGVVFREDSAGQFMGSTVSDQQVGIETNDQSSPILESNRILGSLDAAVILGGETTAVLRSNVIEGHLAIGIQSGGNASPRVESNTVTGGDTAILVTEESQPTIISNALTDQNFGIGVSGNALPIIENNQIRNAKAGALSFEDDSAGEVRGNTITDAGVVGVRVAGQAAPTLEANTLFALVPVATASDDTAAPDDAEDSAEGTDSADGADDAEQGSGAGLLYAEDGAGIARDNQVFGFVIGIQVSDQATPELRANRVDGAGIGGVGILYGIAGAGIADGNLSIDQQLGFQLSGTAQPTLTNNTVENAEAAAFLIQGDATAALSGNVCSGGGAGIVVLENAAPELGDNDCSVQ